jgi:hypothetical protein
VQPPHGLTLHTAAERPDLGERPDELTGEVWPEYNRHGDVMNEHWGDLDERFAELQFVLVDAAEEIVAQGHMVPCRWDGTVEGLPDGIDAAMAGAFAGTVRVPGRPRAARRRPRARRGRLLGAQRLDGPPGGRPGRGLGLGLARSARAG